MSRKVKKPFVIALNVQILSMISDEDEIKKMYAEMTSLLDACQRCITALSDARRNLVDEEFPPIKPCAVCGCPSTYWRKRGDEVVYFCGIACQRHYDTRSG